MRQRSGRQPVPVYIPSNQSQATSRRRLRDMTFEEQIATLHRLHEGLSEQMAFQGGYVDRRARAGIQTGTDLAYRRFQRVAQDLLWLLEELLEESEGEQL